MAHQNSNKRVNELSDDELLNLVVLPDETSTKEVVKPSVKMLENENLTRFFSHYNINPGRNAVNYKVLSKLYQLWSGDKIKKVLFLKYSRTNYKVIDEFIYINMQQSYINKKIYTLIDNRTTISDRRTLRKISEFLKMNKIKKNKTYILKDLWKRFNEDMFIIDFEKFKKASALFFNEEGEYVKYKG